MQDITCITVAVYQDALTYGRKYRLLALKETSRWSNVKIRGDNGRVRWFPGYCFDLSGVDVPVLQTIVIQDDLTNATTSAIEVEVWLSDGQRRWCFFATPQSLTQFGDWIDGTTILFHYGAPHLIIVEVLDALIIEQALRHIERQGELIACTRAIEEPPEE